MKQDEHPNQQLDEIRRSYETKKAELLEILTEDFSRLLLNERIPLDFVNAETGEILIPANRKITQRLVRKLVNVYTYIDIDPSPIRDRIRETIQNLEARTGVDRERRRAFEKTAEYPLFVEWSQSAEIGDADAQYKLGLFYVKGHPDFPRNSKLAQELFLKAAEQGDVRAQVALGDFYGISEKVVNWYQNAANQGYAEAYVKLGDCYFHGWGTGTAKYPTAALWYRKSADHGNAHAQYQLASLCDKYNRYVWSSAFPERSDSMMQATIIGLYHASASQGYSQAQIELALRWAGGRKAWWDNHSVVLGVFGSEPEYAEVASEPDRTNDETMERREDHEFHEGFCRVCGRSMRAVDRYGLWCEWQYYTYEENTSEEERELSGKEDKAQEIRWYREAAVQNGESGAEEAAKLSDLYAEMGDKGTAAYWYRKAHPFLVEPQTAINRTEMPVGVSNIGSVLPGEQPLWRYTRLSTLLSLTWNRIFVPSLATLRRNDPKEALRLGRQTDEFWLNAPREEYDRLYSKADDYERKWLSKNENHPAIAGSVLYRIWQREILNERCAWCWHGADIESMAMWHQYSSRIGIAFKTTVTRLTSALTDAKYCALIGRVNYAKEVSEDYFCRPYFLKEPCYRHEEEVRVIFPYKPSLVSLR